MQNETTQNNEITNAVLKKRGNAYRCSICGQKFAEPIDCCPICKAFFSNAAELKDKYIDPHDATLSDKLHEKYEQLQEWTIETEERTRIEAEDSQEQLKRTKEKYRKFKEEYQQQFEELCSDEAIDAVAANLTPEPGESEEKFLKRKERYRKGLKSNRRFVKWWSKHPLGYVIIGIVLSFLIPFLILWFRHRLPL